MRYILWTVLLSSLLLCFGVWLVVTPNANDIAGKNKQSEVVAAQIYNHLRIALTGEKLDALDATLFADNMLRIPVEGFSKGRLSTSFKRRLAKLLPSYFKILSHPHFSEHIEKIVIESHTSSRWKNSHTDRESFQKNKVLSNQQARAVENYLYSLLELKYLHQWMSLKLAVAGRSSQNLILVNGQEDQRLSKRIEIHVLLK